MLPYHINPATGAVVPCGLRESCGVSKRLHYGSLGEARRARVARLQVRGHGVAREDRALDEALSKVVASGFTKASNHGTPGLLEDQVALLLEPEALAYLGEKVSTTTSAYLRTRFSRALAWVSHRWATLKNLTPLVAYHQVVEEHVLTTAARTLVMQDIQGPLASHEDLLYVSSKLWLFRNTPFHQRAKDLLVAQDTVMDGYVHQEVKVFQEFENSAAVPRLKMHLDDLPEGVLAYDVETDTSRGFGLRPHRTQITEVVLSTKETSWVAAGDERFILEKFAEVLNSLPGNYLLSGWNNWCFDNIMLQSRAEYHGVSGWRGALTPTENKTLFEPVGPTSAAQALTWGPLEDRDVFQEKTTLDLSQGMRYTRGLKPFLESLGCEPVKVDRNKLHELPPEERTAYVLSDGLSTLRASTEVARLQEAAGMPSFLQA